MAQKRISRFPLNEKFSGLSGHVPNYGLTPPKMLIYKNVDCKKCRFSQIRLYKNRLHIQKVDFSLKTHPAQNVDSYRVKEHLFT